MTVVFFAWFEIRIGYFPTFCLCFDLSRRVWIFLTFKADAYVFGVFHAMLTGNPRSLKVACVYLKPRFIREYFKSDACFWRI